MISLFRVGLSLIFITILVFNQNYVQAQQPLEIPRIKGEIVIDGKPDEQAWESLDPLPLISYYPEAGKPPTEKSDVRIGYDDNFIYVSAKLSYADPADVKSTSFKRDHSGIDSDFFGILLDTHNNNETSLAFWVTPTGSRTDAIITGDGDGAFEFDWNEFWDSQAVLEDGIWQIEMRIPFSSLRYQVQEGEDVVMGLIVQRWIARKNESSLFPMIPNNYGFNGQFKPSKSKKVVFKGLKNHTPFRIIPYLLAGFGQQHQLNGAETGYVRDDQFNYDAGLDVKYGLTSNITLDVTVNTDFAQVEADNQQVNLTRYSLFFPEKRQFFQERSNLFNFNFGGNNRLFYTRRIGINQGEEIRILGGARLTGSIGDWDLGFINMQTAREQNIPAENFGVLRLRRKLFNDYSWGGGMLTSRIGIDGTNNYTAGLDGVFRLFGDTYLLGNVAQTFDENQSQTYNTIKSSRIRMQLERRSINGFGYDLEYSRAGERYNPGIGFEFRDDFTKWGNSLFYGWFAKEESRVLNYKISVNSMIYQRNLDGSIETAEAGTDVGINFKSGSSMGASLSLSYENLVQDFQVLNNIIIPAGSYYAPYVQGYFSTSSSGSLIFYSSVTMGSFYDGYRWSGDVSPSLSVSPNLKLSGFYQISHLNLPKRDDAFTVHLSRFRLEYFFSTRLSITTFAQYSNTFDQITSNFRLRFNPREGNDLYIVYNEGLNTNRFDYTPERPFSDNRTILLKYTYTFNF